MSLIVRVRVELKRRPDLGIGSECANLAGDALGPDPWGDVFISRTMRSACGKGGGLRRTALTIEKMAVFRPIPMASAATAVAVKPRFCQNSRREWRISRTNESIPV